MYSEQIRRVHFSLCNTFFLHSLPLTMEYFVSLSLIAGERRLKAVYSEQIKRVHLSLCNTLFIHLVLQVNGV